MRFLSKRCDGGSNSGVDGYWVVEIKSLFSIVLLKFNPNNRENFHSHAFNAITFWLKGRVIEERINLETKQKTFTKYSSGDIKYTPIENTHKVHCTKSAWALCFRGPWKNSWVEYNEVDDKVINLTHGRRVL